MRLFACLLTMCVWPLPAGPALAQAPPTAALIDDLVDEQGRAYEKAREEVLGRRDVVDVARASLERTAYGRSTWRRLVLTEALAMHVTHREEAEHLRNLQGLDSDHYRLRRVPVPSAARELRRLRHVAPLMVELFLKGMDTYAWSSPATAGAEAAALRRNLLMAIGRSGHAARVHFLTDVLEGGCACCESCDTAVRALGETGARAALPVLLRVLDEARANGDTESYATVVEALGGIRHAEVWPHIEAALGSANPRVRAAAIRSAAAYGSRRYWSTDSGEGARIRAAIGSSLVDVLSEAEDEGILVEVLEALSAVATPQLRELLEQEQAAVTGTVRSTASRAVAGDRFQRALDRVNRTLAREQSPREREQR